MTALGSEVWGQKLCDSGDMVTLKTLAI